MKLDICKRGDILIGKDNPKIGEIELDDELTREWYNEVMRRFKEMPNKPSKQWFNNIYDVDESYECGQISIEHLRDMLIFLTK